MKKYSLLFLIFIIFIASLLRLWQLGSVPISPDWDEAALGYNSYSVMQTGHDEYGKFFPVVLRSFNDYKPALYIYLAMPSIALFGLDTFAVRLPSAVFGILTVFITHFIVKELFKRQDIALIAAFLLAISPWHIQFSRVGFEANVGIAFNAWAIFLFLKGLKKPWLLSLSFILFALSTYTYQSEKVFVPLLGLLLILIYKKEFFSLPKKYLITAFVVGFIVILPMLQFLLTDKQALARAQGVSIFSQQTFVNSGEQQRYLDDRAAHNYAGIIFHNKRVLYLKEIIAGYLSHFNLNWLFITGDLERHHAPNMGLLYLWELPFLLFGFYNLLFGNFSKKTKLIIFSWFLAAPIPAAVTNGVPHAVRTLNFLPTFQIFTAIGIMNLYVFINKYCVSSIKYLVFKRIIFIFFFIFVAFNFAYYLNQYFVQQNYFNAKDWQYGFKELVAYLDTNHTNYRKVVISNRGTFDQSYIFFLYYLKYNPQAYLSTGGTKITQEEGIEKFSNFEFAKISTSQEKGAEVLFVGGTDDFSDQFVPLKTILYPDGTQAMIVAQKK